MGATSSGASSKYDLWVVKVDDDGNLLWQRSIGGEENDFATSVAATEDGCIISGVTSSTGAGLKDAWLIKLTTDGDVQWQETIGGVGDDVARTVKVIETGYVFSGLSNSFGRGTDDAWIVSLSKSGAILWQKAYKGVLQDGLRGLAIGRDDSIFGVGGTSSSGNGDYDLMVMSVEAQGSISDSTFKDENTHATVKLSNMGTVTPEASIWNTNVEPQESGAKVTGESSSNSGTGANATLMVVIEDIDCGDWAHAGSVKLLRPDVHQCSNSERCTFDYREGESVELEAVAGGGYTFSGWSVDGGACGTGAHCTISLDADKRVRARFSRVLEFPSSSGQVIELQPISSPSCSNPIGVGLASSGTAVIDLQIKLLKFRSPVDVYLGIMAPAIDPNTIYLITSSGIEPFITDLKPWKHAVSSALDERPFGEQHPQGHPEIMGIQVPPGEYHFYLLVMPAGQGPSSGYLLCHTAVTVN